MSTEDPSIAAARLIEVIRRAAILDEVWLPPIRTEHALALIEVFCDGPYETLAKPPVLPIIACVREIPGGAP